MSGVHPETLRAWERRYEVVCPSRDERGRRLYAEADVARLRLLRQATLLGHPIRHLAPLSVEELRAMVGGGAELLPAAGGAMQALVERVLDALARYRADECDEILGLAATLLDADHLVHRVLTPLLEEVGRRWTRGELCVAQERMLSASVARTVNPLIAAYRRRARGPLIVLATLAGERHELGLLMGALLAAREGLDCLYLGPDVPAPDVALAAVRTGAAVVGLSLVREAPSRQVVPVLRRLVAGLAPGCDVWLGGAAARALAADPLPAACRVLHDGNDLRCAAQALVGD